MLLNWDTLLWQAQIFKYSLSYPRYPTKAFIFSPIAQTDTDWANHMHGAIVKMKYEKEVQFLWVCLPYGGAEQTGGILE